VAMIACGECGRAVSSKARACIHCGAPIAPNAEMQPIIKSAPAKPLTLGRVRRDLKLSSATLLLGLFAAILVDRIPGANRVWSLIAALLLIAGISWTLVTLVRLWSLKK
jgi:hypothetical protein